MNNRLTLKEKLSLPSPKWLLLGVAILVIVGTAKIFMWLVPIAASGIVDTLTWLIIIIANIIMWIMPYIWQSIIFCAAIICAMIVFLWRSYQAKQLQRDLESGYIIQEVDYEIK